MRWSRRQLLSLAAAGLGCSIDRPEAKGRFDSGYKDTIDRAPGEVARILVRFDGYRGRYVFHCHNLEHEDMGMMGNFAVI